MIQRIQSLYLFIVFLLSVSLFFVPIFALEIPLVNAPAGFELFYITSNMLYLVLNSVTGFLSLIIMFLFNNRFLQIRLTRLNMLIICIFIGTILLVDHSKPGITAIVHYDFGCYIPLAQLVFIFLAMHAIRKDDKLIRSADRLR